MIKPFVTDEFRLSGATIRLKLLLQYLKDNSSVDCIYKAVCFHILSTACAFPFHRQNGSGTSAIDVV